MRKGKSAFTTTVVINGAQAMSVKKSKIYLLQEDDLGEDKGSYQFNKNIMLIDQTLSQDTMKEI